MHDKIIDTLNAVRNSLIKGILPGGGVALLHASFLLDNFKVKNIDEQIGVDILKLAIKWPFLCLLENAGVVSKFYEYEVKSSDNFRIGYDLKTNKVVDMIDAGILDSYQNISSYLHDACSIGGLLLTTECMIINNKYYEPTKLKYYPKMNM